jgi:ribose transport system substrate-binding protein
MFIGRSRTVIFLTSFLVAASFVFAGGQKEPTQAGAMKKVTIGVDIHGIANAYWNQELEGAKLFAASLPPGTATVQPLISNGDPNTELQNIKNLVAAKGTDVIFYIDPCGEANIPPIADFLEKAHVYFSSTWHIPVGFDPTQYKYYAAFSSVDGVSQGYQTATALFKSFKTPGQGKVLALQGPLSDDAGAHRFQGLQKALKENPGVQLLDAEVGNWDPQQALSITQTWLAKYPDVDGIWAANDDMALAAVQALKAKGLNGKVGVTGTDGVPAMAQAIKDGDVVATEVNNGYLQGGYMTAFAYYSFNGKIDTMKQPKDMRLFNTNALFVDKTNVAQWEKDFLTGKPQYDFTDFKFAIQSPYVLVTK